MYDKALEEEEEEEEEEDEEELQLQQEELFDRFSISHCYEVGTEDEHEEEAVMMEEEEQALFARFFAHTIGKLYGLFFSES